MGEIKSFVFCPPIDPFCKNQKKQKQRKKNISSKKNILLQ